MHAESKQGQVRMFRSVHVYAGHIGSEGAGHEAPRIPAASLAFPRAYSGSGEQLHGIRRQTHPSPTGTRSRREFIAAGAIQPLRKERTRIR
jgi:hypothetical protein